MNSFSEIVQACNLKTEYEEIYNKNRFRGMPRHLNPINAKSILKAKNTEDTSVNPYVIRVNNIASEFTTIVASVFNAKKELYKEAVEV